LYPGRFETGVVPLTTFAGEPVFSVPPTPEEQRARIAAFHAPYHAALDGLLEDCLERHGRAVLVDAHSVASSANRLHGALGQEIYLGDRDGTSCRPWLTRTVADAFRAAGYAVSLNDPYKGGYITAHYGARAGVDALQIEMAQRVYMDEGDPAGAPGHPRFKRVSRQLAGVFEFLLAKLPAAP
jgi:formiminoglutamase